MRAMENDKQVRGNHVSPKDAVHISLEVKNAPADVNPHVIFKFMALERKQKISFLVVCLALVVSIAVIGLACQAVGRAERSRISGGHDHLWKHEKGQGKVIAPLCISCKNAPEDKREWRKLADKEDICCPLGYQSLVNALHQVYYTALADVEEESVGYKPPKPRYMLMFADPETPAEIVIYSNQERPSAQVTSSNSFNASDSCSEGKIATDGTDVLLQTLCDWPLKSEEYVSTYVAYTKHLCWGLTASIQGLYRIYSYITLNFEDERNGQNEMAEETITLVQRITLFRAQNYDEGTVLAERIQVIDNSYKGAITSYLVTTDSLNIGDIIATSISHNCAVALKDGWHSEGLYLVQ